MNGSATRCRSPESWSQVAWTWPGKHARPTLVVAFWLLAVFFGAADPAAAQRVALVIGNSAYTHTKPLRNPGNDAAAMARVLRRLGFKVNVGTDLDQQGFYDKLEEFGDASRGADVTLFFYAGHGLQVEEVNYLAPVDAKLEKKLDLRRRAIELDTVMENMRGRHNLVFLDACRDNPLAGELARSMGLTRTAAATRGLAPVQSGSGTFIGYATQPRNVAGDGEGRNSPFTAALLEHIETPGQSVQDMFARVTNFVMNATNDRQVPWSHSSLRGIPILMPDDGGDREAAMAYERARQIDTVAAYQEVISRFPDTDEARLAREQIERIRRPDPPPDGQEPGTRIWDCPECPRLVVVPAGRYTMGQLPSEKVQGGRFKPEVPEHPVTIAEEFAVGIHEVTFLQWDACHRAKGCSHDPGDNGWGRGNLPVIDVSWNDAKEYVGWLSRKTGQGYRLLSESEWEYVARARTPTGPFHTGSTISTTQANYDGSHAGGMYRGRTVDVDSLASNTFGLYNVHGNVREWVEDCWHPDYHGAPEDGSAWTLGGNCEKRVARDGSWRKNQLYARFSYRVGVDARSRFNDIGFRVARTLRR